MTRFQEITERYKAQMRETHDRHMQRVAEIEHEHFIKGVILALAVAFFLAAPFLGLLLR